MTDNPIYDLHSPRNHYFGISGLLSLSGDGETIHEAIERALDFGIEMIPYSGLGLNDFEDAHPDLALIFDITSEEVVMAERISAN